MEVPYADNFCMGNMVSLGYATRILRAMMGLTLVYVFYGMVFFIFLISEPTYKTDKDGDVEFNRIVEHIRSNINNK